MQLGELKPILGALALPPAFPLLLALAGLVLARRFRRAGTALAVVAIAALFALSCNGVAVGLARTILPQVPAAQATDIQGVQAIVVLGGGVLPDNPEFGTSQLKPFAYGRLRYGAWLARHSGKPLAYAGGQGWGALGTRQEPEAKVAQRVLQEDYGLSLRWLDDQSRDTRENAQALATTLRPEGLKRIALVTDSWHMPRALYYFRAAGFDVTPAPTHFPSLDDNPVLRWLPSSDALVLSREVLREWLALRAAHIP